MSEPLPSYGAFKNGDLWKELFPDYEKGQVEAATQIVDRILQYCDGEGQYPKIDRIVDLGCGDGSILLAIVKALDDASKTTKGIQPQEWTFLGIDPCGDTIQNAEMALAISPSERRVTFEARASLACTPDADSSKWATTAVVCLSHTWFHILNQSEVVAEIKKHRPALLLIDVFQTWDATVKKIEKMTNRDPNGSVVLADRKVELLGEHHDEETRLVEATAEGEPRVYSLRTQRCKSPVEGVETVVRGIYQNLPATDADWVFATVQIVKASSELRTPEKREDLLARGALGCSKPASGSGKPSDEEIILTAARKSGDITGECDYIILGDFVHPSGWGNMRCIAFGALDPAAKLLNDAYGTTIRKALDTLFVDDANDPKSKYASLHGLMRMFGQREVAIVLPFDRFRKFARMHPLQAGLGPLAQAAYDHELILEAPNRHQQRFPSAYSLFHTLLGPISSPMGVPLRAFRDHLMAPVDLAFDVLESSMFLASGEKLKSARHDETDCYAKPATRAPEESGAAGDPDKLKQVKNARYFIIPIFYGSFPLFTLVLQEPPDLSIDSTDAQVFTAVALNLHRQIHASFSLEDLRASVIAPFLRLVAAKSAGRKERELGLEKAKAAFEAVLDKDRTKWKSWLLAIPSRPIADLSATEANFNKPLRRVFEKEIDRLNGDLAFQISLRLEELQLFDGPGHDSFVPSLHGSGVETLLRERVTAVRAQLLPKADESPQKWLLTYFDSLVDMMYAGTTTASGSYLPAEGSSFAKAQAAFYETKAIFCRSAGNTGTFRFRRSRVLAVIRAACRGQFLETEFETTRVQDTEPSCTAYPGSWWTELSVTPSHGDPALEVGAIVHWLRSCGRGIDKMSWASEFSPCTHQKLVCRLKLEVKEPIKPGGGDGLAFIQSLMETEAWNDKTHLSAEKSDKKLSSFAISFIATATATTTTIDVSAKKLTDG